MLKKYVAPVLLAAVALCAARSIAQPGPGGPGGPGGAGGPGGGFGGISAEQLQQMQDFQQKMMQNMQDKNIDPQQFFQSMIQDIRDGNLDPSDVQQMMVDKGIVDQESANKMQQVQADVAKSLQKSQIDALKDQLQVTDAEWNAIQLKIQKVIDCMTVLGQSPQGGGGGLGGGGGGLGGGGFGGGGQANNSELAKAMREVRATLAKKDATDEAVTARVATWRELHEKAKADLIAAQKDLTELLTPRQEAILTTVGIL